MTMPQIILMLILAVMMGLFISGKLRHDFVALLALVACVAAGILPAGDAFAGFGHPAVITVAAVLVLSGMLQSTGAADALLRRAVPASLGISATVAALVFLSALLSAFMNNVGALALLMPVAVQIAARQNIPPGKLLMPIAFGSILGGMTTLIGTPPNLIVASFRMQNGTGSFSMFDFSPVGVCVALAGVCFIALVGWRLVPARPRADIEGFETGSYLTEAKVPEKAAAVGMSLREAEQLLEKSGADAQIVGFLRDEKRFPAPHPRQRLNAGDVLVLESDPEGLQTVVSVLGLVLEGEIHAERGGLLQSDEIKLAEMVVLPDSGLTGRSASDIYLRSHFDINLLAISRQGVRSHTRLRQMPMAAGDVLLLQGSAEALSEFAQQYSCVPLAERPLRLASRRDAWMATLVMAGAIGAAAMGADAAIAFVSATVAAVLLRLIPARNFYSAIDWPVIVLLGALIPVAGAVAETGMAAMLSQFLVSHMAQGQPIFALALILVITMSLSDVMNNAATAAILCPIAVATAKSLDVSADPFLMAVAIGASCAFLTPIGHQNNTLILGPGGFRFGDYWRMGLPLEILVIAVSMPALLFFWPL
ncbi:MAG: SLC13 family permease [Alphaproteobacteria bacterium]|nr:SLC13 family permease [Alphaproteobacteria bacterium]